jgi:hypothetical protein
VWSDVDLDAKTITIRRARVEITGVGVVEEDPRPSEASEHRRWMTLWWALCSCSRLDKPKIG